MRTACVALAALCAALLAVAAAGAPSTPAVLAIDLGSESLKVALVRAGKVPITIVLNEMSRRKTPALVAFVDGERLVGEDAATVAVRYPERVYGRLRELLGTPHDAPHLLALLAAGHAPYDLAPAPNRTAPALAVRTHTGELFTAEEIVVRTPGPGAARAASPAQPAVRQADRQPGAALQPCCGCPAALK